MTRIVCTACAPLTNDERRKVRCHECGGLGYIEHLKRIPGCRQNEKTCPFEDEPMVDGWMCTACGESGPW